MKQLFFVLLCSLSINLTAQTPENLYHYCKLWGLLKYYTPEAGRGKVNVDELFLATWPAFKQCKDQKDFDAFLQTTILAKFPSMNKNKLTDQAEVFLLNQFQNDSNFRVLITFDWVKDDYLSKEVQKKLIGGLNTYKGVKKKWMKTSWAYTRHKEKNIALLPNSDSTAFRTLSLFKYWNWVEYFFAYKNLMDTNWDQDLKHFCQNSSFCDDTNFSLGMKLLSAKLQDHHAAVGVNHLLHLKPNYKEFPFSFRRFGEVYRITSTDFSFGAHRYKNAIPTKLKIGDTIESINDFTIKCWDDQISQYISKSKVTDANKFTALENLSYTSPVCMDTDSLYVTVKRANEKIRDTLLPKLVVFDSMQYIEGGLRKMEDNPQIAYISMNYYFYKKNKSNDLKTFFKKEGHKPILIIDQTRQPQIYPYLAPYFSESAKTVAKAYPPMGAFPGVYKRADINLTYFYTSRVDLIYKSIFPNTKRLIAPKMKPYNGTVILIVTADLYSSIETQIMLLQAYCEKLIIIGQETPGTNGDITTLGLPLNIHAQMTGTIFEYPDGRQFQRKGIVPDIIVDIPFEVEQKGSIAKREFMIDKAFNVAQEILNKSSLLE